MKKYSKLAAPCAVLALMAGPAWAAGPHDGAQTHADNPGAQHRNATPGPHASLPTKARAYGRYCKTESRKRADAAPDTKGSPFSQCVTAMAKLASGRSDNPREACKLLSKKRADAEPGTKGTPFSQCVSGAARLLRDRDEADEDQTTGSTDEQGTGSTDEQAPAA